ncbi:sulfurtransferase [Corynebacterium yudongzhengii]|uniref:thiosulfate sulfurtransferase n=1 Tax=Corynebacterium yudongzhengii TaxID=2080740 RepID=A0A2U1T532_9CORY|nr:sulfurtransferase [Corynebacterium yudongzhengii]AWB82699.1 sulfurtransferase [Corynebacterium yudongzhengii]PWC00998.1 sulfurtransferase [Corynebacterium yudongzhengii]
MSTFISVPETREAVYRGRPLTILASIWEKDGEGGHHRYQSGHIPTAHFCDPAAALTGLPGSKDGRNPLPKLSDVQRSLRFWGVRAGIPTVTYDQGHGLFAGRAWWVLRWAGVRDVQLLDGGLRAWHDSGAPVVGGPGNIAVHSDVTATTGNMPTATIDDVRSHEGVLIDVRQPNRFAGRREILDLKAGHIPGAINVPVDDLFTKDRLVKSPEEIRARFAQAGIEDTSDVIMYSGSGNHSALAIAALEHAGMRIPAHFVGGWSQWSADSRNPVERGD